MNKENLDPEDVKFHALLQEARMAPSLPPRFQENVWQRIEKADALSETANKETWLDTIAARVMRPRFAFAAAAALVLAGALLGAHEGNQTAQQNAQARYLAAVAPAVLR